MGIRTIRRFRYVKLAAALASLLLLGVFASAGLADSGSASSPTVATDKAAYVPGETVRVSGAGWLPNESVHVHAAADSRPFAFDADVVASVDGSVAESFDLPTDYADTFAVALSSPLQGVVSTSVSDAFAAASAPPPPTIVSDKADYSPGSTVTLTGANWKAGESVRVVVNDTVGQTWQYAVDSTADSSGGFTLQVQLPNYFVSDYDVTATGAAGKQASTTFTDGNATLHLPSAEGVGDMTITFDRWSSSTTCNGTPSLSNQTVSATSGGTVNIPGFGGNGESVKLKSVSTTTSGKTFSSWTSGDNKNDSGTLVAGSPTPCISNSNGGSNGNLTDAYAHFVNSIQPTSLSAAAATGTYGGITTLSATLTSSGNAVSGKTITFKLNGATVGSATTNGSGIATLNNASLSGISANTYATGVAVSFAGDTSFSPSSGTASLTISPKPATATADNQSKTYGQADPAFTFTPTGVLTGDTLTGVSCGVAVAHVNVGSYDIACSGNTNGNYSVTYVKGTLTISARAITVTADAKSKTYGNADPTLTYQVTSGSLAGGDTFSGSLTRDAGESIGQHAIKQGTLSPGSNYDLAFLGAKLTIKQRQITVTADAKSKTYGNADPALTYQVSSGSLQFSDTFSGSLTRDPGQDVGQYDINQGTLSAGSNYDLTFVAAKLTINQRPIEITADAKSKTYGADDPALTYQITSGTLAYSDAFSGSLARDAGENVGQYDITQGTLALNGNYTPTYKGAKLTIGKRPVEITADDQSKVYGNADPALTYQITKAALAFSDAITGSLSRDAGESVAGGPYAIKQGTLALNDNYDLTFKNGSLSITNRPVQITADAKSKTYGDGDPALTYKITDGTLAFGDAFSGNLTRDTGESVGAYDIGQGSVALNANYTLTYKAAKLTIDKRPVEVTATDKTKVYGDDDPTLTYNITKGSLAFSDTFTGSLTRDAGESVPDGPYAITQGTFGLSDNYDLTFLPAKLTITKATLAINADGKTKVYGNDNPAPTYSLTGFKFSDTQGTLTINGTADCSYSAGSGPNVGSYPDAISCGPGTLSSANYGFAGQGKGDLAITRRPIEITANAQSRTYGDDDPALSYQITSGSLAYTDVFTGKLDRAAGEAVGDYAITQGTVALNANYDLAYKGAKLAITKRPVEITADANSKTYGDPDPALTYQITTGTLAFSDTFTGNLTRDPGQMVGDYAITQGTVALNGNYDLTYKGAKLTVGVRPVEITADAKSKTYGDPDPALTFKITKSSLVYGDAFSGDPARDAGKTVGDYAITQGTLSLNTNYDLAYVGAKLTITKRTVTGNFTAVNKVYDRDVSAAVTNRSLNNTMVGDDVSLTGGAAAFANRSVGTGKTVTLSGASLSGADAGNYTLGSVAPASADITSKPITGSFTAANKVYDGNTSAIVVTRTANDVVAGDVVNLSGGTATFDTKNVGVGKVVTLSGAASLTGSDASNYSLMSVGTAKADITKAPLTVTADNLTMTLNGTVPPLTYKVTGFVGGDPGADVTGAASCTTSDGKTIGTFDIVCSVGTLDAQNYSFPAANFVKGKLTVYYRWDGFLQPINDTAHTGLLESKFKLGQTIPAKFVIKDAAGNIVQQVGNPTFSKTYLGDACGQTVFDSVDATVTPDPSTVYTSDGSQYHFNWSTKGLKAGEYRIYANLADGTKQSVNICLS